MTPEQQRAVEEFKALRGVEPFGPFLDLLASPELMTRVGALGEYLRYRSALPPRLSELAILITAAHWQQRFEWDIHAPIALQAGVPQQVIDDLWSHIPLTGLDAGQQALYQLCLALLRDRAVSPALRQQTEAVLGKQATIDAIAICGYYALLAMILNSRA
ncbi:MAG TPA: carboxymuconolactone decarboxylase family protein [Vicinamibacterales bacterium]